ncbi:MAG: hypothetical protein HY867_14595 [Chloroflexi bacterium]|nr:hypothetical protein [Chloroflexota bacterium]
MKTSPARTPLFWPISLLVAFVALLAATSSGFAAPAPPPGPDRFKAIVVNYTSNTWFLATFRANHIVCKIVVEHEGIPSLEDVYASCGEDITNEWIAQPICKNVDRPNHCKGYYIFLVESVPGQRDVAVELPPPAVWVNVTDCLAVSSLATSVCEYIPKLMLTGEEPLPEYDVSRVEGTLNGQSFSCEGETCAVELQPTGEEGVLMEFWAYSTYGDSSKKFTAQVRVTQATFGNPDAPSWFVDVRSSQWRGVPLASCAETWQIFPPVGGPPQWLATPNHVSGLSSTVPYAYLAANLIKHGQVDASACADGGLTPDGRAANECGLAAASDGVNAWQNRFDTLILEIAHETGVPAQLLKNLFARESQFWPGTVLPGGDTGLGQITQNGADTTLLWNPSFYNAFCPLALSQEACESGYMKLEPEAQELLRHALVNSVNATCATCPLGIDLDRADYSVSVFAHTLTANCQQATQVIWNYSDKQMPGQLDITYEDMWKFTLINYNAGGGCLADALQQAYDKDEALIWDNVSKYLAPACRAAIGYVEDISR